MTRISNADQVLLLLHEQLDRLSRKRAQGGANPQRASPATPEPMARLRAMAAQDGLAEEDLRRALVRGLLTQQLGDGIANDPAFASIASEVGRLIEGTVEGRALLDRALAQLSD